ncbi:uncharacterized protein LOC123267049 isoform X2 [Cotesia glomerata]|uniref:F-box domain-containing protein n=2 Tax=Cotesia glomerata TaxID=32391 RepID=A0AAV7HYF5_COTGL|nr:uncharacterized protein LOC123267049 isoform X2 [Cotesia glomerata]XP_044587474.1 uncharacterized protein LOC123267049 isoform X2 [Cotesia glomerata]KAH0535387.1 hypothetical protein KQX54_016105 [Cotesia glomerata]
MKMKRSKSLSPEPSSSRDAKIPRLSNESAFDEFQGDYKTKLLDFSDDVLLNIFKYVSPQDLFALSSCCHRLNQVCRDRTLWKVVNFKSRQLKKNELIKILGFLKPNTESIIINGRVEFTINKDKYRDDHESDKYQGISNGECKAASTSNGYIRDVGTSSGSKDQASCSNIKERIVILEELKNNFLTKIGEICTSLKELVIEEFTIVNNDIKITDFPSTLEKLSLKGCKVCNVNPQQSYFSKLHQHMPNLTTLIVTDCQWLRSHSLMVISKIPKLKELRISSCKYVGDCVAYMSLATRFGFKSLGILDLCHTNVGDSEVSCFFQYTTTLTELYLDYSPIDLKPKSDIHSFIALNPPVYEDNHVAQYVIDGNQFDMDDMSPCGITDRCICSIGSYQSPQLPQDTPRDMPDMVIIEPRPRICSNPILQTLVVRNYPKVTDASLKHLAEHIHNLKYVDLTGTSITRQGVENFKCLRPNVKLISSISDE